MTENERNIKIGNHEIDPELYDLINSLSSYAGYMLGDNTYPFLDTILRAIRYHKEVNEFERECKRKQKK